MYFHARTKEGYIDIPMPQIIGEIHEEEEPTLEGTLAGLRTLLEANVIDKANYEECVKQAEEKFKAQSQEEGALQ